MIDVSLVSSSHLLFFKNSCQTQLCTKFIHIYVYVDMQNDAHTSVADPGGVQDVQTLAFLFRCPFLKRTYFENMSLRFLAGQGAS